jgi:hypothetical protein
MYEFCIKVINFYHLEIDDEKKSSQPKKLIMEEKLFIRIKLSRGYNLGLILMQQT